MDTVYSFAGALVITLFTMGGYWKRLRNGAAGAGVAGSARPLKGRV